MKLANPIYDAAFKFLLEDTEIAKGLIGHIINEEIVELTLKPQEIKVKSDTYIVVILRIDFKATIKTKDGQYKKVLIEIQKGKQDKDILRFRKYLGANYRKIDDVKVSGDIIEQKTLPIITIYFLGFRLANIKTPVMKADRTYIDLVTNLELSEKEDFVEQLTHDGYFIQIPRLHRKSRNKLERILKVFNQSYKWDEDNRLISIDEKELNEDPLLKKIGDRLMRAAADEDFLDKMELLDEVEGKIEKHIRENEQLKESVKLLENQKTDLENQKTDLENQKTDLENQKTETVINLIKMTNLSDEQIAAIQQIEIESVRKIRKDFMDK